MTSAPLRVVSAVLFRNDSVLLVRHHNSKHIEGIYGLPGGKVDIGETEAEAARRELEEETGLRAALADMVELPTLYTADVRFRNGSVRRCVMRSFLCKRYEGEVRLPTAPDGLPVRSTQTDTAQAGGTSTETSEWVPREKVASLPLLPNVQEAIQEALKLLG